MAKSVLLQTVEEGLPGPEGIIWLVMSIVLLGSHGIKVDSGECHRPHMPAQEWKGGGPCRPGPSDWGKK